MYVYIRNTHASMHIYINAHTHTIPQARLCKSRGTGGQVSSCKPNTHSHAYVYMYGIHMYTSLYTN